MLRIVLITGLLFACSRPTAMRPNVGDATWHLVESEHFVVTTDLPADRAMAVGIELEAYWDGLAAAYAVIVPGKRAQMGQLRIVHLAHCRDLRRVVWHEGIGGYVTWSNEFRAERVMVTCDDSWARREVLIHELAHNINNLFFRGGPRWVNEGLAGYFQTLYLKGGRLHIGGAPQTYGTAHLRRGLAPVAKLITMDHMSFYANGGSANHLGAWRLVHLLASEKYNPRFRKLIGNLASGLEAASAWQQAFDGVALSTLQKEYEAYYERRELDEWTLPYAPTLSRQPTIRELGAGEAHAVWIQLLITLADALEGDRRLKAIRDARAQVGHALEQDPSWPDGLFWQAAIDATFSEASDKSKPLRLLRQFAAAKPDDPRARLGIVRLQIDQLRGDDGSGLRRLTGADALEPDVKELVRVASRPAELHLVGLYYGLRGEPETGYSWVKRALDANPGCRACYETMAMLAFRLGKRDEAIAFQRIAIGVSSHGDSGRLRSLKKTLTRYRASSP